MKRYILVFATLFVLFSSAPAFAQSGCTGGYNSGYLHVDCATSVARDFWTDNPYNAPGYVWNARRDYRRFSATRVDILGSGWRYGTFGCRWAIVRGDDWSKYINWHPNSSFNVGCGGV